MAKSEPKEPAKKDLTDLYNHVYQMFNQLANDYRRGGDDRVWEKYRRLNQEANELENRLVETARANPKLLKLKQQAEAERAAVNGKVAALRKRLEKLRTRMLAGISPDKVRDELVAISEELN